jgi:hypothetical protein
MSDRKRAASDKATAASKKAKVTPTTVEQCVEYFKSQKSEAEARRKLLRYIRAQFPAAEAVEVEQQVLATIAAEQADAFIVNDEDDGDPSDESESGDDGGSDEDRVETTGDDDADLFDLDQFKKGGTFDEATALREFDAWKKRRNQQRGHMMWQGPIDCPEIPEDAFEAQARVMNKNANDADRRRIADIEIEIAAGGLSAKDLKLLHAAKARYQQQIDRRPEA